MQQLLPIITLIVGVAIGYALSLQYKKCYDDMKGFANAYSSLATQLFNAQRNQTSIEEEPFLPNRTNHRSTQPQPGPENDLDLLAGVLDPGHE